MNGQGKWPWVRAAGDAVTARRGPLSATTCGFALWVLGSFPAAEGAAVANKPVLTNAQQIRLLTRDEAGRGYPVRLRAVVTYFEPAWNTLFVQDATGGLFVFPPEIPRPALRPGQEVELEGESMRTTGPTANGVQERMLRVTGTGPLPRPAPTTFNEMISGRPDGNLVELQGYARTLWNERQRMEIDLAVDGGKVRVHLPWPVGQPPNLDWLHARLRVTGVAGLDLHEKNPDQVIGVRLFAPGPEAFEVVECAEPDPDLLRQEPLRALARYTPQHVAYPPVRVAGIVTLRWPSGRMFIQDDSGSLELELGRTRALVDPIGLTAPQYRHPPVAVGDRIAAIGYPALRDGSVTLEDVELRLLGPATAAPAIRASASDLMTGEQAGRLVELEARLTGYFQAATGRGSIYRVLAQSGGLAFEAHLPAAGEFPHLTPGSTLRLTGVCSMTYDAVHQPRAFQLLLRGPSDLALLDVPRWWSSGPVPRILGAAAALGALGLGWVALLRRQVRQRTAQLSASAEQLRQSEERFSKAFRASSANLAILDARDGRYVDVNDAFLKSFGFTREEVLGRTSLELGLWQDPAQRAGAYRIYETQGFLRDFESRLRTRTGESKIVLQSGDFITIGQRPCILSVGIDITDRKRAEAELVRNLEQEKELSHLKTSFVSTVSHEFRTPLEIIVSSADILERYLDRLKPAQRAEHLASIQKSAKSMAVMMEEMLLLGRFEAGRLQCAPDDLHLPAFCKRLVDEMRSATNDRCPIELSFGEFPPLVRADENLLRHVLTNLLSNAVKYSSAGKPVRFHVGRDGPHAVFRIEDSGIGIPATDQARLFEAFHRASNTGQISGTGLGLHIVKRCVDLHDGTIRVQSEEGRGTIFTVRLPLFGS